MYTLGIDIGSTATKGVIMEGGTGIVATAMVDAGTGTSGAQRVLDALFSQSGLSQEDMAYTIATGYGRTRFEPADKQVSELTCHAKGAAWQIPDVQTIIDIGGQDGKAIKMDGMGGMVNFVMNEKCAAGTGRFLDGMARILETSVGNLNDLDLKSTERLRITSTCTVFAESEVISLLSNGAKKEDIAYAIHESVAKRACSLARRVGVNDPVVMTGGVARNQGVVRAIERELGTDVIVPREPQLNGAIGAALLAWQALNRK